MPLPAYNRKFTPSQLNALVDDAVRGVFVPMGQGQKFEEALFHLAHNQYRTEEDIARVRDMTKYNWRAASKKATRPATRVLPATHRTQDGRLAANIRDGVFLIENALPLSDIEARLRGIEFEPLPDSNQELHITAGMLEMAKAYQHPALAH